MDLLISFNLSSFSRPLQIVRRLVLVITSIDVKKEF